MSDGSIRVAKITNPAPIGTASKDGRGRKKLFMTTTDKVKEIDVYKSERQDDFIEQHASDNYMDRLDYNIQNCLEVSSSIASNLKIAATLVSHKKFAFQNLILKILNQISRVLNISRVMDFLADKGPLASSSKLRSSFYFI